MNLNIVRKYLNYGGSHDSEGLYLEGDGLKEFNYEDDTKKRNIESYDREVLKAISNVTYSGSRLQPFGSWTYRSQLYPGDIDLLDFWYECCSREEATEKYVKIFQNMIYKIMNKTSVYMGDIKTGIDRAFIFDIGSLRYFTPDGNWEIKDYHPDKIHKELKKLYNDDYLTKSEYEMFIKLSPNQIDNKQFEILRSTLRDKWLLRWTPKEIAQGYKVIRPNRKYTLAQSMNDPTMLKLDTWTQVHGKFLEVSNIIFLYYNNNKKSILMNYKDPDHIIIAPEELRKDVQLLVFSPLAFRPFKALKRMWSIARMTKNINDVKKMTPIMQTDLGRLAQINSEIEVMILILKNLKDFPSHKEPPINKIKKQLDDIKYRIQNVYDIPLDMDNLIAVFNSMQKMNNDSLLKMLMELKEFFKKKIDIRTVMEMKNIGLWPPPKRFLPLKTKYDKYSR